MRQMLGWIGTLGGATFQEKEPDKVENFIHQNIFNRLDLMINPSRPTLCLKRSHPRRSSICYSTRDYLEPLKNMDERKPISRNIARSNVEGRKYARHCDDVILHGRLFLIHYHDVQAWLQD
jgi:hypothetical protein